MNKCTEYMTKEAQFSKVFAAGELTSDILGSVIPYLLLVPLLAGAGTGYIASRMTSPAAADIKTLQKETLLGSLKSQTAMRQRKFDYRKRLDSINKILEKQRKKVDPFVRI